MGASGSDEFRWVGATVWRLKSETLEQGTGTWLIEVEWQRVRDKGEPTPDSPTRSRRLYLRPGERVTLDSLPADNTQGGCGVEGRLEAGVGLWPLPAGARAGGARAGGGTGGRGGSGVRASGGSGGGATFGPTAGPPVLNAELWLVHTRPDGSDEARRLQLALPAGNTPYEFAPMPVDGRAGKVNVQVKGSLRPTFTDGEVTGLHVMIDRRVQSGDARVNSGGGTFKKIPLPKPADVVAIEMPPAGSGEADQLAGHQFSLRLRVGPPK